MLRLYRQGGEAIDVGQGLIKITVAGVRRGSLLCFVEYDGVIHELPLQIKEHNTLCENPQIEIVWLELSGSNYVLGVIAPHSVKIERDDYVDEDNIETRRES